MKDSSLFKKILTCFIAGLVLSALLLVLGNSGTIFWFPPLIVFSLVGISLLIAVIFPFVWQYKERSKAFDSVKVYAKLYTFIRYCIAFNLAGFGWKRRSGYNLLYQLQLQKNR